MTVYVDEIKDYGDLARERGLPNTHWCHLTADTKGELHKFAESIGLKREWFQEHSVLWHYDITPTKRKMAVQRGAVEMTSREMTEYLMATRAWGRKGKTSKTKSKQA